MSLFLVSFFNFILFFSFSMTSYYIQLSSGSKIFYFIFNTLDHWHASCFFLSSQSLNLHFPSDSWSSLHRQSFCSKPDSIKYNEHKRYLLSSKLNVYLEYTSFFHHLLVLKVSSTSYSVSHVWSLQFSSSNPVDFWLVYLSSDGNFSFRILSLM